MILSLHGSAPKNTTTLQSKTPSAHTYRLLVFKEHSPKPQNPKPLRPRRFRVAASAAQKRDYVVRFAFRQQVFYRIVTNFISQPPGPSIPCERRPAWLSSYRNRTANPQLPASLRLIQKRRGRILVGASELRKGFVKRILKARRKRLSGMRYRGLNSYRITVARLTR